MSHITMQRIIVRMLYDTVFARKVYDDPKGQLGDLDLDEYELSLLKNADPRAWRLDPLRRARSLEALLDEYPASAALVAHTTPDVSVLDAFFSSTIFHQCIQHRRRLAISFGSYLRGSGEELARRDLLGIATLERSIATFRRDIRPETNPEAGLCLAANLSLISVPTGTLEVYVELIHQLSQKDLTGAAIVVSNQLVLRPHSVSREEVTVLLETSVDSSGPSLSVLDDALGRLLTYAQPGISVDDFYKYAVVCGAEVGEEQEILDSLIEDGLIQEVSA